MRKLCHKRLIYNNVQGKTLLEIWDTSNRRKKIFIWSSTNKTKKYRLLSIKYTKNFGILSRKAKKFLFFSKTYYDIFVLNNPRWFNIKEVKRDKNDDIIDCIRVKND